MNERLEELRSEWSGDIRDRVDPEYWRQKELLDEVERLRSRVATLVGVLRSVEWINYIDEPSDYQPWCPACGRMADEDHSPDCALDAALREVSDDGDE
jgi:hypothetical protein